MRVPDGPVDRRIAAIADRSHGVVTRRELLANHITERQIEVRLRRGSLLRVHRGVYRVGHRAASVEARYLAAVLACGDGSVLIARPAGYLLGLLGGSPPSPDVIALIERKVRGVRTHRVRAIDAADVTLCRGVPVTSIPRTLVDLAGVLTEPALARACHEAQIRARRLPERVEAVLGRLPTRRGAGKLREILHGAAPIALSRLEQRFLALLQKEGLPLPATNRPQDSYRVDCRWADHRLTVELDSYRYHHTRHAFERDRHREREAYARGDSFRRYTWRDVVEEPALMLRELRRLLGSDRSV
jgi:hypothetical protein